MLTSIILSFIGAVVMAMVFEAVYHLFPYSALSMTKYELSIFYWALIALLGFGTGGGMFVAHLPAIAPAAIAHIQLSKDYRTRITVTALLHQVRILAGSALARLKTWCKTFFTRTP